MERFNAGLGLPMVLVLMCVCIVSSNKMTVYAQQVDHPLVQEKNRACVEAVVNVHVYEAVAIEKRMAASLLRLHFHDCFVGGCDASLLLDGDNVGGKSEKYAPGNNNSVRGYPLVDKIKESITSVCKVRISCADILALAARSGVQAVSPKYLKPTWKVAFGRYDSKYSHANDTGSLPGTDEPMANLMKKFANQNVKEVRHVVALIGGGHTIGKNHCSFVKRRLYGNATSKLYADPDYVDFLQQQCPEEGMDNDVTIALDNKTENTFDNGFFLALREGRVSIKSDQLLADPDNPPDMRAIVNTFTDNQDAFFEAFGAAMEMMGSNGILSADEGEIRTNCHLPNGQK